jgi:hypothetical protein
MAITDMIELFITQIAQHYDLGKNDLEDMWKVLVDQKCNHLVKKGTPEEYVCGKTIKSDGKCYKHVSADKKIKDMTKCCTHIIHKKDGTEVQCIRNIKENGFCGKHFPKKGKIVNITTVIKCCHIIKKKDGSEAQCDRNAQNNGKYCGKHTKKTAEITSAEKNRIIEKVEKVNEEIENEDEEVVNEEVVNEEVVNEEVVNEEVVNEEVENEEVEVVNKEVEKYANLFSEDEEDDVEKCNHVIHKKNGDKVVCGVTGCKKHNAK